MECFSTLHGYRNSSLSSTHTKDFSYTNDKGEKTFVKKGTELKIKGDKVDNGLKEHFKSHPEDFRLVRSGPVARGVRTVAGDIGSTVKRTAGKIGEKTKGLFEAPSSKTFDKSSNGTPNSTNDGSTNKNNDKGTNETNNKSNHNETPSGSNGDSITHNKEKPDRKENGEELPNFINEDITLEELLTYSRED